MPARPGRRAWGQRGPESPARRSPDPAAGPFGYAFFHAERDPVEPPAPTRARQRLLYDVAVPLALVLGTSLLYAGVANHSFLHWDDQDYVSENPHVLQG